MFKSTGLMVASCALALVTLTGCGGGGSGGSSGAPVSGSPTPAPTPTPTPTPSQVPDNGTGTISSYAPFGVTRDTEMGVIGWLSEGGATRWLEAVDVSLTWLSGRRTFQATFPTYGTGEVVDDPNNAARAASFLVDLLGKQLAYTHFYIPGSPSQVSQWTLAASFAAPDRKSPPAGHFVYFAKGAIQPPTTGRITYGIPEIYSDGSRVSKASLAIDFDTGKVTGSLSITYSDAWGPYPETFYEIENGAYDRNTGMITGTFQMPGSGFDGTLRGQVLGPQGTVVALVARGATIDPYERKWSETWFQFAFLDEREMPAN